MYSNVKLYSTQNNAEYDHFSRKSCLFWYEIFRNLKAYSTFRFFHLLHFLHLKICWLDNKIYKKLDNLFEIHDFFYVIIPHISLRLVRFENAAYFVSKQTWLSWKIMIFRIVLSLVRFFFAKKIEDLWKFGEKFHHFSWHDFLEKWSYSALFWV